MKITKLNLVVYIIAGLSVAIIISDVLLNEPMPEDSQDTVLLSSEPAYEAMAKGFVDVESGVIKLAASRDGIIKEVLVEEGAYVESGQVLAIQDVQEAKLNYLVVQGELDELKAALEHLKVHRAVNLREKKRLMSLTVQKAVAQRELDAINDQIELMDAEIEVQHAAVLTAEAKLRLSEYEVEMLTIRAPADGYIARRLARPGDGASTLSVTPLFWFIPKGPLVVRAEVDEQFIDKIEVGMSADVTTLVNEHVHHKATVLRIGRVLGPKQPTVYDPRERSDIRVVECVLELEENAQQLVLGQRVIVRFNKL